MSKIKKVLICGATGFMGRNIAEYFKDIELLKKLLTTLEINITSDILTINESLSPSQFEKVHEDVSEFEKILNELGSAGWEAIGIGHGGSRDGHETRIILKREVV